MEHPDLLSYLKSLPPTVLNKLFQHPPVCLAVFRCLNEYSRMFISRLLFVGKAVPKAVVWSWLIQSESSDRNLNEALGQLTSLHILVCPDAQSYALSAVFTENMRRAACGKGVLSLETVEPDKKHAKDLAELQSYAVQRWESLLYYMALSSTDMGPVSVESREVLSHAHLVELGPVKDAVDITSKGFQFLLMDRNSQIWTYIIQYLNLMQDRRIDITECTAFLMELTFCRIGQVYSCEKLNNIVQDFLQHLREIGLIYQVKRKTMRFIPTQFAFNLSLSFHRDSSKLRSSGFEEGHGFIVVETNFRVYAYTESPLQLAIISTFCDMMYRFPNLAVGVLTRESVRKALNVGISAKQIIQYLRSNAHGEMLSQTPIIPATICDQLQLWELERERLSYQEGVLYSQFLSDADFGLVSDYAKTIDVHLWDSPAKRMLVVSSEGHEDVRKFWKAQKK